MSAPNSEDEYIRFYLGRLRAGDHDAPFHSLLELGPRVVPRLVDAFRTESSSRVRAELVRIIWNTRAPGIVPFLGQALDDIDAEVWKSALDGLVAAGSSEAVMVLQANLARTFADLRSQVEFRSWVEEAIAQIEGDHRGQL